MLEFTDASWPAGPRPGIAGVNLRVAAGESVALLNLPSVEAAALLRVLQGDARPASGAITFNGRAVRELRKTRGAVVRINGQGMPASGRSAARAIEAAARGEGSAGLMARVGLSGRGEAQVRHLDTGARVRLAVACAFAQRAKLILLDNPAANMDRAARSAWLADLPSIFSDHAGAVVLVGAADEARALGGAVVVFDGGAVVQQGAAGDVFDHPCRLSVAVATSSPKLNLLPMTMQDGAGRLQDGSRFNPPAGLRLPDVGPCTLAFRPGDIVRERADADCVRFVAREEALRPAGPGPEGQHAEWAPLSFGGSNWLAPPAAEPRPGRVVNAFVPLARLLVFDADGRAR